MWSVISRVQIGSDGVYVASTGCWRAYYEQNNLGAKDKGWGVHCTAVCNDGT